MGPRYTFFRLFRELSARTGFLKRKFPTKPPHKHFISLAEWRTSAPPFFIVSRKSLKFHKVRDPQLKQLARNILKGRIPFFGGELIDLQNIDWVTNPVTGYHYDKETHWTQIQDLDPKAGDIKYVWEKSRFTFLQYILRYDYHFDEDHAEWVFNELDTWIDQNPINCGPNWRCSQEMSLRILNWMYILYFYRDSSCLTESRWTAYQNVIYWHLHHIYNNIHFSRIAVRNNHAITETGMLAIAPLLFPFLPEVKRWGDAGRKWLEEEILYQIYPDGTYLQFSMNYHRVVIQLLTAFIGLTEKHQKPLSEEVKDRAYASLDFLYSCQQPNGELPNYGSNDGALFFQWSGSQFRDYRPQLNSLHQLLTGNKLYQEENAFEEDKFWWGIDQMSTLHYKSLTPYLGIRSFNEGGYYTIRDNDSFTFLRCGGYKDRPLQADNLHLDIWKGDQNTLRDAGSYKYNTDQELLRFFMGTLSHNTVMLEDQDQMLKGGRFMWFYWTQCDSIKVYEDEDTYAIEGQISAFEHVSKNIKHQRKIVKYKGLDKWEIVDYLRAVPEGVRCFQLWHYREDNKPSFQAIADSVEVQEIKEKSYYSNTYGQMEEAMLTKFPFKKEIRTTITLQ